MKAKKRVSALISCMLAAVLALGISSGCNKKDGEDYDYEPVDAEHYNYGRFDDDANFTESGVDDSEWNGVKSTAITDGYEKGNSRAPQTSEYLGTVTPVKPVAEVCDERETYGVTAYPQWGTTGVGGLTGTSLLGVIQESRALTPYPTWKSANIYDALDSEGYLLRNGERVRYDSGEYRKLYKHTAAESMYGGGLSDDEPRIAKQITCITRAGLASNQITGLYAPAGEVIKVEISQEDLAAIGGTLVVYIGQNYNLDQQVSMEWNGEGEAARIKGSGNARMSDILNKFEVKSTVAYVGSFIGGPIYIRPGSNWTERNITVKISGGVRYQHFILGATTEEEYNENKKSSAPYFDLEVYDKAIRFSTTKHTASGGLALKDYTYQNCTDAAILWDKITQVSKRVGPNGLSSSNVPVMVIGDCYIAAGAAFANPGRNGVVCPPSWLAEALNYNNFVNSGCWGTMHEYNHCWQGYGLANNGEVTNNATTLVSYSLYTRISASRTSAVSWGNGGWNRFTDPSRALADLLVQSNTINSETGKPQKCFDLPLYATLIHNIGQDSYIEAAAASKGRSYYDMLVSASHYDMTYYFTDILNFEVGDAYRHDGTLSQSEIDDVKSKDYPVFVPVSSVYQVGRSVIYDDEKQYITTAQPFSYGSGEFTMDFNNHNNFKEGSFVSKNLVIPDGFTAKVVSVTQPENGTVELLENNMVKYTPASGDDGLYSGNFRVKLRIIKDDRRFIVEDVDLVINLKQSAGTDLNRTTYVYDEGKTPDPSAVLSDDKKTFDFGDYAETETRKNVCTQETNTQIWQAGWNYYDDVYNKDSKNYEVMPANRTLQTMEGVMYFSAANTYRFTLKGRGKATLYLSYDNGVTWENALTISRSSDNKYVASEYSEHEFTTANNYVNFKVVLLVTKESDFFGIGVAAKQEDNTFSSFANASAILNADVHKALREESSKKFETPYRFTNEYKFTYSSTETIPATENSAVSVNYEPWSEAEKIDNLFDGDSATSFHTVGGEANYITAAKPLELVVDLGKTAKLNCVTFTLFHKDFQIGSNLGMVKDFQLYGSKNGTDFELLLEKTGFTYNSKTVSLEFSETEMRYYKLVVTKTDNGHYFAMNKIEFSRKVTYANGNQIAPNDFNVRYIGDGWDTENALCNFGIIYTADVGDSVEFHFTGTRCAYVAYQSADYGTVDIYVDGVKVAENVDLSADKNVGSIAYMYLDEALDNTVDHVLKIVGKTGKFNVDSFVYWN